MTTQGKSDKVSELYNNFLRKYFYEQYDLPSERKEEMDSENRPIKFKIKGHDYKRFYNGKPDEDYDDKYIINNMIVLMNIL